MSATADDMEAVIGDECHIVARSPGGPRFRALPAAEVNTYENLLLLCRNHHKLVDDQPETFSEPILRRLKANHERWVARTLDAASQADGAGGRSRHQVRLLTTGEEILDVIAAVHAYDFSHDSLNDEDEVALVGGFLQSAQDWAEIWDDVGASGHVEARFHLGKELKALQAYGFLVYGAETVRRVNIAGKIFPDWRVAVLRVLRTTNPNVPESHRAIASTPDHRRHEAAQRGSSVL
jgi:hypothetical protein